MNDKKVAAVDLFCGAGGLTRGLEDARIPVKLGIDVDPACKYPYEKNNGARFLKKSVEDVTGAELQEAYGDAEIRILAGCAPCQTFSTYNQKANSIDKRWWLLLQFERLIQEVEPEIVTMENVPGLEKQEVFKQFMATLEKNGKYQVSYQIVRCEDYGLPQNRNRLVLLASKNGKIELLSPDTIGWKRKTVREAIEKLAPLEAGGIDSKDSLHKCSELSELNLKRIKVSTPGGTWRDWPQDLVADCHKKKSGKTYPGVYGRMCWDEPSPTLTTQFFGFGNGRFGHPEQNRGLSLREGAILQTFPEHYKFTAPDQPIPMKTLGRLIGNAVPVRLGELIGRSIVNHIDQL
ncbi:MAG: DNA cytosine methyltransferase [Pseudomonadota bacterium]